MLYHLSQLGYKFPDPKAARAINDKIKSQCETCQVTEGPMGPYKPHLRPYPVPPHPMTCVAMDLMFLPEVTHDGQKYDVVIVCVDRHTGWILAIPALNKGLTAEKVAKLMMPQWDIFGVTREITSDRGSHFIGGWWRTICGLLGIRTAYAQAYHHQANGRVENANMQLLKKLRQLINDKGGSWAERLPCAVRLLNDMPNEFGLSPYELLFGRPRCLPLMPYRPPQVVEDAAAFFRRKQAQDEEIARKINQMQDNRTAAINKKRKNPPPFVEGAKVWYHPEMQPEHDKTDVVWKGPALVTSRVAEHSYEIDYNGVKHVVHLGQMRRHIKDEFNSNPVPLNYYSGKAPELEAQMEEWDVETILEHKLTPEGTLLFKTRWEGSNIETWQDPLSFVTPNEAFMKYCLDKNIPVDVSKWWRLHGKRKVVPPVAPSATLEASAAVDPSAIE